MWAKTGSNRVHVRLFASILTSALVPALSALGLCREVARPWWFSTLLATPTMAMSTAGVHAACTYSSNVHPGTSGCSTSKTRSSTWICRATGAGRQPSQITLPVGTRLQSTLQPLAKLSST